MILTWMDARTVRTSGARAEAADLYDDYRQWMAGRGMAAATKTRFGSVLSESGLAKRKAGAKWTVNYLGLQLKPSGGVRARIVQMVPSVGQSPGQGLMPHAVAPAA